MKKKKWKRFACFAAALAVCAGLAQINPLTVKAADYEARIGDNYYDTLEEAFEQVKEGDTVEVLKDCSVSETLMVKVKNVALTSGDASHPATVSREEAFTGFNFYKTNTDNVLVGVRGSLTIKDIILDGGAVLDEDFNNTGQTWDSPLVYVEGALTVSSGAVFQNNYNTDGNENNNSGRTAGAIDIAWGNSLVMDGGVIRKCYTNGGGGGISAAGESSVTITAGTVEECYGKFGGALDLFGTSRVSGMDIHGNKGLAAAAVGNDGDLVMENCTITGNVTTGDSGTIGISSDHPVTISGCTISENKGRYTSGISVSGYNRTQTATIKDCIFRDNIAEDTYSGTVIKYTHAVPLILDGNIVMEGNTLSNGKSCDIYYMYGQGVPVTLGADFESSSHFVLFGRESAAGDKVIDASTNGNQADLAQFSWKTSAFRLTEEDGDIYLSQPLTNHIIIYYTNNRGSEVSSYNVDPTYYTSEDTAVIKGEEMLLGGLNGFAFDGWNTSWDKSGTDYEVGQEVNLTKSLILYAKWKRTSFILTYEYNGGEGEKDSDMVAVGEEATLPDASREGYRFTGWYQDEALTDSAGNAGEEYAASEDVTLYAGWEAVLPVYTVTFDPGDGECDTENLEAEVGEEITLPGCTKEGHVFIGWYEAGDGGTCVGQAGEKYEVQAEVTLTARYQKEEEPLCVITFDADGGQSRVDEVQAKKGDKITLPNCEKEDYRFTGWYSDGETLAGKAGDTYTVTADVTLKAHFEEIPVCTVTFDTDGGEAVQPMEAQEGDTITLPGTTKEGFTFLGWYADKEGRNLLGKAGSELKVTIDMTVYALWEKDEPETCKVIFQTNGGTLAQTEREITKNGSLTLPLPEREGYEFAGWYRNEGLTLFAGKAGDKYRITQDVTFYAKWEEKAQDGGEADCYTVTFNAEGGSVENASVKVVKGKSIKLPTADREGYLFKGWHTPEKALAGLAGESYKPEKDITLYAQWEEKKVVDPGEKEPVIQTGHISPVPYFILTALAGLFISLFSCFRGKKNSPQEKEGEKKKRIILMSAGAALMALALAAFGIYRCREAAGIRNYQKITRQVKAADTEEAGENMEEKEAGTMPEETIEDVIEDAEMEQTQPEAADGLPVYNWNKMQAVNGEACGWLYLPGSLIDFPVVAALDNAFYLTHDFTKEKSSLGCLFMDKWTEKEDFNRVIYGHNMGFDSNAMFSTLLRFKDRDYFEQNRVFYYTEAFGGADAYEVMAVMEYDAGDVETWDFRERNFDSEESCSAWMEELKERAVYYREPEGKPGRLLTLSTCDRSLYGKDGRLLVFLYRI